MQRIIVFIKNALLAPEVAMAIFLRNRGWVVFYLDPIQRECRGVCWMKEYAQLKGE